ncbi:hypothetical protein RCH14_001852 [Massilia sp. MP_M2]|uniref:hypothetical protein n=1 Tax=Massilia sp. MP_M2 TaxID=3071713 RepID=UPI00319E60DB
MKYTVIQRALVSGAASSIVSTVAMALVAKKETGSPYAATNAVSHYVHGRKASFRDRFSLRYTVPGLLIHHASATVWALVFERVMGGVLDQKNPSAVLASAAATSAFAAFTDHKLAPRPLQPGYQKRLSNKSLGVVYTSIAVGMALGSMFLRRNQPPK